MGLGIRGRTRPGRGAAPGGVPQGLIIHGAVLAHCRHPHVRFEGAGVHRGRYPLGSDCCGAKTATAGAPGGGASRAHGISLGCGKCQYFPTDTYPCEGGGGSAGRRSTWIPRQGRVSQPQSRPPIRAKRSEARSSPSSCGVPHCGAEPRVGRAKVGLRMHAVRATDRARQPSRAPCCPIAPRCTRWRAAQVNRAETPGCITSLHPCVSPDIRVAPGSSPGIAGPAPGRPTPRVAAPTGAMVPGAPAPGLPAGRGTRPAVSSRTC